jgi:multicomponent Na+:H+ antiporter subunit G
MAELAGVLMVALMVLGALLILIAAVGILRMPDLLTRMHASSKAGTLGTILILAGVALAHGELGIAVRAVLVIAFLFLTAPVAAHVIARAAQRSGSAKSTELVIDEWSDDQNAEPPA